MAAFVASEQWGNGYHQGLLQLKEHTLCPFYQLVSALKLIDKPCEYDE